MADAMKMLPCPMCGGEATLLDYEARYGGLHYASRCPQCASCGCSMGYLPTAKKAVEAWNCRASMPTPEKAPSFDDARRKLIHCIEQWDGETEYDAEDIAALADDILDVFAAPPAREEAPAEGAGVKKACAVFQEAIDDFEADVADVLSEDSERADLWDREITVNIDTLKTVMSAALRNRTSEPEAIKQAYKRGWNDRESDIIERAESMGCTTEPEAGAVAWRFPSALQPGLTMFTDAPPKDPNSAEPLYTHPATADNNLGDLLARIHRDGGHRQAEIGADAASLEAEAKVVAMIATADKLKVAVEALEKIADEAPYRSGYCQSDIEYGPKLSDTEMQAEARAALAALNEQPQ